MKADELYANLRHTKPMLIYISGKTCTGKTTLANRLRDNLGHETVELDAVARDNAITPLGLADADHPFVDIYKTETHSWSVRSCRQQPPSSPQSVPNSSRLSLRGQWQSRKTLGDI